MLLIHSMMMLDFTHMQCLQYKTDQQTDLRKIEKLNRMLFSLMATGEAPTGACLGHLALSLASEAPALVTSGCRCVGHAGLSRAGY